MRDKMVTRCPSDALVTQGLRHALSYSFGPWDPIDAKSEVMMAGYGYNIMGFGTYWDNQWVKLTDVRKPTETYWVADNSDLPQTGPGVIFYSPSEGYGWPRRHRGGVNMLWVDGHVTWISDIQAIHHSYYNYIYAPFEDDWWDLQ
jgi:prepilin-type processing-associated H-X9-DG protein